MVTKDNEEKQKNAEDEDQGKVKKGSLKGDPIAEVWEE